MFSFFSYGTTFFDDWALGLIIVLTLSYEASLAVWAAYILNAYNTSTVGEFSVNSTKFLNC